MRQCSHVDGRCDGARDEGQGSERVNKTLRLGLSGEVAPFPLSKFSEMALRFD